MPFGGQIDAGKPLAAYAFVRIPDHLNRLAPDRLRLKAAFQRVGDEVDKMEERLGRLDAAREALALRRAENGAARLQASTAKRNRPVTREFCENCGTHLTTRRPDLPLVILKVGTLDDPSLFGAPQMAIYTVDKQPFHMIPEGVPTFEREPPR